MRIFIIILLSISIVSYSGCEDKEEAGKKREAEAEALYNEAGRLDKLGKEIEVFRIYDNIAKKYSGTEVLERIKKKLEPGGYSPGTLLKSWTSRQMIKLENILISYKEKKGSYPTGYEIKRPLDAWGNEIRFEIADSDKSYDFTIISLGPDGIKNSSDDFILPHKRDEEDRWQREDRDISFNIEEVKKLNTIHRKEEKDEIILSIEELGKLGQQ